MAPNLDDGIPVTEDAQNKLATNVEIRKRAEETSDLETDDFVDDLPDLNDSYSESMFIEDQEEKEFQFSWKQMYYDTINLNWSKVKWDEVVWMTLLHVGGIFALWYFITGQYKWQTFVFLYFYAYAGGFGVTLGNHRLWSHKTFKVVKPVELLIMFMNCIAFQESIFIWSRNHRVHHKWPDTPRDFTTTRRGFFFAHMGWKMYETDPEVYKARKMVDVQDLINNKIVWFQHCYFYWIAIPIAFFIPVAIPVLGWNEDFYVAIAVCVCLRLLFTFHVTWCINSVAHLYGYKPYDKDMHAYENFTLGGIALGEGWHNFHHSFPRDYRTSEINTLFKNFTTNIIEFLAWCGLAYDLRKVSEEHIKQRSNRTGDLKLRKAAFKKLQLEQS